MNGISFRDILNLFCCPPRPAQIVAKLAFLPPTATYRLISKRSPPPLATLPNGASPANNHHQHSSDSSSNKAKKNNASATSIEDIALHTDEKKAAVMTSSASTGIAVNGENSHLLASASSTSSASTHPKKYKAGEPPAPAVAHSPPATTPAHPDLWEVEFELDAGWTFLDCFRENIVAFYASTSRRSRIVCFYMQPFPPRNLSNILLSISPHSPQSARRSAHSISSSQSETATNKNNNNKNRHQQGGKEEDVEMDTEDTEEEVNDDKTHTHTKAGRGRGVEEEMRYSVLFSHGNAVDLGHMASHLQNFAMRFGVNMLCYDYSGYGLSSGSALEANIYADAEAALLALQTRFGTPLSRIVLYGQSIGTAPTIYLAAKYRVAGVVLHSPLSSGLSVVFPNANQKRRSSRRRCLCFDPFPNYDRVARIESPTLIIHGTEDEIISLTHGKQLYERLRVPVEPAWVVGAGHNDVEIFPEYLETLERFFEQDLPRLVQDDCDADEEEQRERDGDKQVAAEKEMREKENEESKEEAAIFVGGVAVRDSRRRRNVEENGQDKPGPAGDSVPHCVENETEKNK